MMNDTIPKVKTANVLLVNVDDRQTAMLRMAFKMYNSIQYTLLLEDDLLANNTLPDLVLVDGDNVQGDQTWEKMRERFPDAKVIFFGRNPPPFTAPYLPKPIQFNTLFTNLRNLQQGNGVWVADNQHTNASVNTHTPQEKVEIQSDSSAKTTHNQQETIVCFNVKGTLFDKVKELSEYSEDTAIIIDNKPAIVVFPSMSKVLLVISQEELHLLCEETNREWQTRPVPTTMNLHDKANLSIQALIWQLAIWTAKGRLIEPITPDTTLSLKTWPNMTRLAALPESMRLSAFLVRSPVALNTLYKLLPVSLEHVLNYIAATYAIGSLTIEQPVGQAKLSKEQEMILTRKDPQVVTKSAEVNQSSQSKHDDAAKPKGLLSRLMGRLRGN